MTDTPEAQNSTPSSHPEFLVALAEFVKAACSRLERSVFPRATVVKWRYDGGTGTGNNISVIAPGASVQAITSEWELWSSYKNLVHRIENDSAVSTYLFAHAGGEMAIDAARPFIVQTTAAQFLYDYLVVCQQPSPVWMEERFRTLSTEFTTTVDTGQAAVSWWSPLYNAHWVGEPVRVNLQDDVRLVEPADDVLLELQTRHRQSFFEPQLWVQYSTREQLKLPVYPPPVRPARLAATAIRLVVGGFAFTRDITMLAERGAPGTFGSFGGWHGLAPQTWGINQSVIQSERAAEISEMATALGHLSEPFDVVINRYEAAVSKALPDERLIDAVIALEALILAGDRSTSEVTFRFASTGSWLLGKDRAERIRLFELLTELYRKRSDIVHGDRKVKRSLPDDPSGIAVDILQRLLRDVAARRATWDDWVKLRRAVVLGRDEAEIRDRSDKSGHNLE